MTIQEFINYYKNGHGRAIYCLKDIDNKEPYRKAFIECLKEQDFFFEKDRYIIDLAKILLTKETEKEFIDIIWEKSQVTIPHFTNTTINILLSFLPIEEVIGIFEKAYKNAYKNCMETIHGSSEEEIAISEYIPIFSAINRLMGDDDNRLTELIKDAAEVYEAKKGLCPNLVIRLKWNHRHDEERFNRLFDKAINGNPLYEKLNQNLPIGPFESQIREYKTVEDYLEGAKDDLGYAYINFCSADDNIVKAVAEVGVGEDAEKGCPALELFIDQYYENLTPQPFPLESKPLINIVEKYKHLFSTEPDASIEGFWAIVALKILATMKEKSAKEYCLSLAMDDSLHQVIRTEAVITLRFNYVASDYEYLTKFYYELNAQSVLHIIVDFSDRNIKDAPYELCFDAYENKNIWERMHAVTALAKMGLLTPEMINECKCDENKNIRHLVSNL